MADPELRRQYAEEIAPRTVAALAKILGGLAADPTTGRFAVRRALDLGAGTGAASGAIRARFGPDVEIVAVDRVHGPGILAADVTHGARPPGVTGRFDLIVAAHLLNELVRELAPERRAALVAGWCAELLVPGGLCVLLEPALRETSRGLLAVRDRLVAGGLFVVAPCLWQGACPALARERDWCHDATTSTADGRSRVDFSYLVVALQGEMVSDERLFRIVSDPLRDKGRMRFFGCGPIGRHSIVRLDRDRNDRNRVFDEIGRGDLVGIEGAAPAGDGLRVGAEAAVFRNQARSG